MNTPYLECGLCDMPALYQCDDCRSCFLHDAEPQIKVIDKVYIGSGEDFCMEAFNAVQGT